VGLGGFFFVASAPPQHSMSVCLFYRGLCRVGNIMWPGAVERACGWSGLSFLSLPFVPHKLFLLCGPAFFSLGHGLAKQHTFGGRWLCGGFRLPPPQKGWVGCLTFFIFLFVVGVPSS